MKPAVSDSQTPGSQNVKQLPTLSEYIDKRDYTGALTLLEVGL